jgi:hypothetical protein
MHVGIVHWLLDERQKFHAQREDWAQKHHALRVARTDLELKYRQLEEKHAAVEREAWDTEQRRRYVHMPTVLAAVSAIVFRSVVLSCLGLGLGW